MDRPQGFDFDIDDPSGILPLIGSLLLVASIFGGACIGVVTNLTPAENIFTIQAQRNGFLVMMFSLPAFCQGFFLYETIDWAQVFSPKTIAFLVFTIFLQQIWTTGLYHGSRHMV